MEDLRNLRKIFTLKRVGRPFLRGKCGDSTEYKHWREDERLGLENFSRESEEAELRKHQGVEKERQDLSHLMATCDEIRSNRAGGYKPL